VDIKEQIAVMQGFADGKEISYKLKDSSWWKTPNSRTFVPIWNWSDYDYRIKPAPPIKEIRWGIYAEKNERFYNEVFSVKSSAERLCKEWNTIAKCENAYRVVKLEISEIQEDATQS